jgi:hypothetical protein
MKKTSFITLNPSCFCLKLYGRNCNYGNISFGLFYKHITIVNDASSVVSLIDDARVVSYDRNMFIVQATGVTVSAKQFHPGVNVIKLFTAVSYEFSK